jgi:2TM domain
VLYILKRYDALPFHFPLLQYLNLFVMSIWTFIITIDGISVFMSEIIFGKKWEERKLKKLMQTKSEKQIWK